MRRYGPVLLLASALHAQTGQQGPRSEWPCVAGRAVDPAYLETSESTGGQLFLLQKNDIGRAGLFLSASYTHPATVERAVGTLSGKRDFSFPVDSTVQSLLVMVSLQCRTAIGVFRPSGAEMTAANSAQSEDLQAGKILKIDNPEPGMWTVRLEGTGVFVVSAQAKSDLQIGEINFVDPAGSEAAANRRQPRLGVKDGIRIYSTGHWSHVNLRMVDPSGEPVSNAAADAVHAGSGVVEAAIVSPVERFRIQLLGTDDAGWPVQRTYPVLFHATPVPDFQNSSKP